MGKIFVEAEYARLRKLGWTASYALRAARIKERFDDLEGDGFVRLTVEPDQFPGDTLDDLVDKRDAERALREGVWGLVASVLKGGEWEQVDSVWGFVGDDWRDSGYDTDLMQEAIDAYKPAHWVYGSGMVGCLYDNGPHCAATKDDAIEGALSIFDDLPESVLSGARSALATRGIYYFDHRRTLEHPDNEGDPECGHGMVSARELAGADYVEISEHDGPMPEDED